MNNEEMEDINQDWNEESSSDEEGWGESGDVIATLGDVDFTYENWR